MLRLLLLLSLLLTPVLYAQTRTPQIVDIAAPRIVEVDLRDLPIAPAWQPGDGIREVPRQGRSFAREPVQHLQKPDVLAPQQRIAPFRNLMRAFATPDLNFAGQAFSGSLPADPVGAIGQNFYIQAINFRESTNDFTTAYAVYDKTDGAIVAGPFLLEDLGAGSCGSGKGDPIILYDQLSNRWLLSEFTEENLTTLCVYISRTDDPVTGGWFAYSFEAPEFPDYPKYGLHPSAYFVSSTESEPAVWALDRQNMIAGNNATFVRFTAPELDGFSFDPLTPADLDGSNAPVSSEPCYFMRHKDDEIHEVNPDASQDFLELYAFTADFDGGNHNFVGPFNIAVSEFDSSLCPSSPLSCVPQPDGPAQDAVREVIMHRLTHRIFNSHESLVGSFTVDVTGNDFAGIRWFELRKPLGGPPSSWALYQEGTYTQGDGLHRWMPSIAMDQSGNIAMGFRASSDTQYTSLRYVGRLASDPLGIMTEGEHIIVTSSESNPVIRNGDYAAMTIDPVDDCAFWFTSEYFPTDQWQTQVASFSFDNCGCERPATPGNLTAIATPDTEFSITLNWNAAAEAETYAVYRAQGECTNQIFDLVAKGVSGTTFVDQVPSGGIPFSYQVRAIASDACSSFSSDCANATATGPCLFAAEFNGASQAINSISSDCGITIDWNAAVSRCGDTSNLRYSIYRSSDDSFQPTSNTLLASCIEETSYTDTVVLEGQTYYYIVRSEDLNGAGNGPCSGGATDDNLIVVQAKVEGNTVPSFFDDFEGGTGNFSFEALDYDQSQRQWSINTLDAISGTNSIFVRFSTRQTDQVVQFANDQLIAPDYELSFYHRFEAEAGVDGGVLEYTTNGSNWFDILEGNPNRFLNAGYNTTMTVGPGTPLDGREAWSGSSEWVQVRVDLSDFAGETMNFRWRAVCDFINESDGWRVDDIQISEIMPCARNCDFTNFYDRWRKGSIVPDVRILTQCVPANAP